MGLTNNVTMWNALRKKFKSFETITSEATKDTFTDKGWSEISRYGLNSLNQFFQLSMRVAFNKLDIAKVNTRLEESGIVEVYGSHNGGYLQRISIESIAPISPKYLNLADGSSVDPFVVRKPNSKERFFECGNFNYQSLITLQEYQVKTIFLEEYGMANFIAGIMAGLENGYKMQKELNIYKAIHECINSVAKPLQDTQIITLDSWTDAGVTDAELLDFVANVQDIATVMETSITQPGFNANGFDTAANAEDYVLLVRAGIMNKIRRQLRLGAFNPEDLALPFKILEVQDFGGITYDNNGTQVYPEYDSLGAVVKGHYTTNSDGTPITPYIPESDVTVVDTDAEVLAVLAQRGLIFEEIKEPYQVRPIQNPAGLYENYWCSAPNNMIRYDANYGCIVVKKPESTPGSDYSFVLEGVSEGGTIEVTAEDSASYAIIETGTRPVDSRFVVEVLNESVATAMTTEVEGVKYVTVTGVAAGSTSMNVNVLGSDDQLIYGIGFDIVVSAGE